MDEKKVVGGEETTLTESMGQVAEHPSAKQVDEYTSAGHVKTACLEDYKTTLDTYNLIYNRVNVALVFCGVIFLGIMDSIDNSIFQKLKGHSFNLDSLLLLLPLVSAGLLLLATILLLHLMKSKYLQYFDSLDALEENIYRETTENASLWLADQYAYAVFMIWETIMKKQRVFNLAVILIIISIVVFFIHVVLG